MAGRQGNPCPYLDPRLQSIFVRYPRRGGSQREDRVPTRARDHSGGARSAELTIPIVADPIDERTESFNIDINTLTNAQIGSGGDRTTVTIVDNDRRPRVDVGDRGRGHSR